MVAFLFSDVEGSTRLWEHPQTMGEVLADHDRVVREAIEERGGYVFSMAGDAFSAAFSQVPLAVAAAATAQRGLQKLEVAGAPLRVRMAVHVGNAQERDGDLIKDMLDRY